MIVNVLIGALMIGSIYGIVALGYSIIYRASGLMTFMQGELLMVGSFLGLTFYRYLNIPFAFSLILTMLIMFMVGFLIERTVIKKLTKKNAPGIFIVLATIALAFILKNGVMLTWGSEVYQFPSIFGSFNFNLFGVNIQPEAIIVCIASVLCMIILHFFMTKTRFGTAMRAAAQDPMMSKACGINVSLTTAITWGISSGIAALGGILISPLFGVSMTMGNMIGLKGFSAAVIGGYGNMYGAVIGGLIIGILETFTAYFISSDLKNFIAFLILLVVLFLRPSGLFNEKAIQD